jgi:hypothetical protein
MGRCTAVQELNKGIAVSIRIAALRAVSVSRVPKMNLKLNQEESISSERDWALSIYYGWSPATR